MFMELVKIIENIYFFTHTPEKGKEENFEKLNFNIDPNDKDDCYVKKTYEISEEKSAEMVYWAMLNAIIIT